MSAGVCSECGRKAPDVDDVMLLAWEGGTELHFDILDEDMVTLVCPDCVERRDGD